MGLGFRFLIGCLWDFDVSSRILVGLQGAFFLCSVRGGPSKKNTACVFSVRYAAGSNRVLIRC